ncbi:dihydrofolate reductase family protein [Timonella sp. A28]|uniref:dihydrofolate reductase family protein n=1 Tax=Timonella sp. A28 TaxID=3442640 RepID=UPI003EBF8578
MDVIYSTATSVNGYIADQENSLDWLFEADASLVPDHAEFLTTVGAIVMGATTYEWLMHTQGVLDDPSMWSSIYGTIPTFVFTHRDLPVPAGSNIMFVQGDVTDHVDAFEKATVDKKLWVVGGGDLAGQFIDAGLLTEIVLSIAPAAVSGGAPVLPRTVSAQQLHLVTAKQHGQFAQLTYSLSYDE